MLRGRRPQAAAPAFCPGRRPKAGVPKRRPEEEKATRRERRPKKEEATGRGCREKAKRRKGRKKKKPGKGEKAERRGREGRKGRKKEAGAPSAPRSEGRDALFCARIWQLAPKCVPLTTCRCEPHPAGASAPTARATASGPRSRTEAGPARNGANNSKQSIFR